MRSRRLYAGAKEVIFELEKMDGMSEQALLHLEVEKAELYLELGDWWRATPSLTQIIRHPDATGEQVIRARLARSIAAFEAGEFQLSLKDLELSSERKSFEHEMLFVQSIARSRSIPEAIRKLTGHSPKTHEEYFNYIATDLDLNRLGGRETMPLAKALVILSEQLPDPERKALAWIDYLISLQWEPLRIRNDHHLSELLTESPRAVRLLDELSSPGLDLFRSTRAKTLIQSLRTDRRPGSIEDLSNPKYVFLEKTESIFLRERSTWIPLRSKSLDDPDLEENHVLKI